jgi:hypothetical protein
MAITTGYALFAGAATFDKVCLYSIEMETGQDAPWGLFMNEEMCKMAAKAMTAWAATPPVERYIFVCRAKPVTT